MPGSRDSDHTARATGSDERLLATELSFEELFAREYRGVVGVTALLCGDRSTAEELAQDAFVSLHRHWGRVVGYDDPAAWLRRVATNLAVSSLRRRTREARALLRFRTSLPVAALELPADAERYWDAVRALPARQAQCVALRYFEDRPIDEIASILGIAASTVRVHLHQARKALAEHFDDTASEE
jgi:RNA polymerase sigma-70 factor, ECF subfamily